MTSSLLPKLAYSRTGHIHGQKENRLKLLRSRRQSPEKLNNPKPLLSRIEELYFSKDVKENALASERKSRLFSRGVILTRARVSHALLSLRKNGGLLVVYVLAEWANCDHKIMYKFNDKSLARYKYKHKQSP